MWHAASEEQKNPYDIPCSREQTWIKIDFTKRPLISCKNELYPHKESRRFKCSTWHIYFPLSPYIYCHFIFTTISNQFRRLGCFGLVLCFLVFNSDNKANDWWVPCAYFGCVWHPDPLPGDWYLPNTLKYFELCCFWKRRLRPRQTFGGCVLIWSRISCEIFHSLLAFSGVFFFSSSPSFVSFPGLFYRLWPEGLMKAATQQRKEWQVQEETRGSLCCLRRDKRRIWQSHAAASKTPIYWSGLPLCLLCHKKKEREREKDSKKKNLTRGVCESWEFHLLPLWGEENAQRPHKLPQTTRTIQLNTVPTPLFTIPNHVRSFSPL